MTDLLLKKLAQFNYIILDESQITENKNDTKLVAVIVRSLASIGYKLDFKSLSLLLEKNNLDLSDFYFKNLQILQELKGEGHNKLVFYKNFPDIKDISEEEMAFRQILHYLTSNDFSTGFINEEQALKERLPFDEKVDYQELTIISKEEGIEILSDFVNKSLNANKIISNKDLEVIYDFCDYYQEKVKVTEIPFKENMISYVNIQLDLYPEDLKYGEKLERIDLSFIKTLTDCLRLYASQFHGRTNLNHKFVKIVSLDRKARRVYLKLMNEIVKNNPYAIDEMHNHKVFFKVVFEKLHVGEYAKDYPELYKLVSDFRNKRYVTYNSKIESAINLGNEEELIALLKIKPGYFLRMIDRLLRTKKLDQKKILNAFKECAKEISNTTLISLWEFYQNRNGLPLKTRNYLYHNDQNYMMRSEKDKRPKLNKKVIAEIIEIIEDTLSEKYASLPKLEGVYLDPNLVNYTLPLNNKNASNGFKTLAFGTRIKIDTTKKDQIMRFFTHWKNIDNSRVDIDLSLELFDKNFHYVNSVAWHNQRSGFKFDTYFSGDITSAPKGANEYIDLNYLEARKECRYICVCNTTFTRQAFKDVPECFSGLMLREAVGMKGEIFDARTVQMKYDLCQEACNMELALVIDLEKMELIWCDVPFTIANGYVVSAENNAYLRSILLKLEEKRMTVYDLIKLHSNHLSFVNDPKDANFIISDTKDAYLNPTDLANLKSFI